MLFPNSFVLAHRFFLAKMEAVTPQPLFLYGSSCNPPTGMGGHRSIVKALAELGSVLILPVYQHVYPEKILAPFEDRFTMARYCFETVARCVVVSDLERTVKMNAVEKADQTGTTATVGTFDLMMYAKTKYPNRVLHWVMGADTFADLRDGKWTTTLEKILEICSVLVVPRKGVMLQLPLPDKCRLLNVDDATSISSTQVRESLLKGEDPESIHPTVLDYIKNTGLYGVNPSTRSIAKSKASMRFGDIEHLCHIYGCQEIYDEVLEGLARNVKVGPFTATSGIDLPYYLNASTNFLDMTIAHKVVALFVKFMVAWLPMLSGNEKYIVCGMEMAGGIVAGQLASAGNNDLNQLVDFVYIRKERKTSGTCQQLEGPNFITQRTSNSQVVKGIWVDDANSTGSSLMAGIKMLKAQYNIEVTHALYLVDRFQDREQLPDERQYFTSPVFSKVDIKALYDLEQVDNLLLY